VGLGFLFGIRIPQNFNSPYKAADPSDFWRRWHISLSTCMRDYLYIPFGGNRGTKWQVDRNLMLTMLIGGLWHGASWTFVIWGAYHGLLLIAYRRHAAQWDRLPMAMRQGTMFVAALVGWVFFRATSFPMAASLLQTLFVPTGGELPAMTALVLPMIAVGGWWAMRGPNAFEINERPLGWGGAVAGAAALGASLAIIAGDRVSPFLYFQF
jgi:alginate O-acetyltransferase complex protein AlgI